ncbi:enoyl-CoA hydratase [Bowmanella pacifica]|uniref:Enoyl-CoA hydratase n=1 Tax=Bowmanella pacifica TaxID=502051 RepID=A0A917YZJ0_9ALTE|nr:enoyl-CoA hydratase [Bowmanella pacifica]GGO70835.1 enoyl-CoA hydratase [Bowmanella pacifica]
MSLIQVLYEQHVLKIQLNRADKKNALSTQMYGELAQALEEVKQDPAIRAVLLCAAGNDFTAGNDLADFADFSGRDMLKDTERFMHALLECPLPVVAQVQGMAVGIGTTLLLHCDLVYCSPDSRFALPFINLGLVPEYASSYLLPKRVGHAKAAEWLMLGDAFGAEEALQHGLVNKIVDTPELTEEVNKVLAKLVTKPRQALALTKQLMKGDIDETRRQMGKELACFIQQLDSPAAKEAFAAFLQKRKPDPAIFN